MLQEIVDRTEKVEAGMALMRDALARDKVDGFLRLAKTYRKSKNYPKALKFLEQAEEAMNDVKIVPPKE